MTATLWIDESKDETIELGDFIGFCQSFGEMAEAAGGAKQFFSEYPNLGGLYEQVWLQADSDPAWLTDMKREAARFLDKYRDKLTDGTVWVLEQLVKGDEND